MNISSAIVIPFFRNPHEWYEEVAIKQAIKVLNSHDHFAIIPQGFDNSYLVSWYGAARKQVTFLEFDVEYFKSPATYNKLLLSSNFYEFFLAYQYILIYQTDAYIFKDELQKWVAKSYDYVGAPWIDWIHASSKAKNNNWWTKLQWTLGKRRFDAVGNGGFSLRKVVTMINALTLLEKDATSYAFNEDFFFSFEAIKKNIGMTIPSVRTALEFGFDECPENAFEMANRQLPMGCHGWPKYGAFWKKFIPAPFPK